MAGLRLADLARLFTQRYGPHFPNDDAGTDDLTVMLHHIAHLREPNHRIMDCIAARAPWMPVAKAMTLAAQVMQKPRSWSADKLATIVGLTTIERYQLKITTIGAIDQKKEQRTARRRKQDRMRKFKIRRAKGAKRRIEYEAASDAKAAPWIAQNISRRTYYRRRAKRGTSPSAA